MQQQDVTTIMMQLNSSLLLHIFFQHAGVRGEPEEESKERPNNREPRLPAALPIGRHAPLQGTTSNQSLDTLIVLFLDYHALVSLKNTAV